MEQNNNTFKGREIYPKWLDHTSFKDKVKNVSQLRTGSIYLIVDPGLNNWHGDIQFTQLKGGKFIFEDVNGNMPTIEYTLEQLEEVIESDEIYKQQ